MADKEHEHATLLSRLQANLNDFYKLQGSRNEPTAFDDETAFNFSDWVPKVEIKENRRRFLVNVDVPGIDPKNLEVTLENGILAISGERQVEKTSGDESNRLCECSYGAFERRFNLPATADDSKVSAKCRHGVLTVTIGKKRAPKADKIAIE